MVGIVSLHLGFRDKSRFCREALPPSEAHRKSSTRANRARKTKKRHPCKATD
jgi:hypothetical protein